MRRRQTLLSIRLTGHSTSQYSRPHRLIVVKASSANPRHVTLPRTIPSLIKLIVESSPSVLLLYIASSSHDCMMLSCPTSVLSAHPLTLQYPLSVNCSIIASRLTSVFLLSLMTPPLNLMAPVHPAITHHVHRHLQSIISFPPVNCHIFLHWQPLNFLIPITELAQIKQGQTHKWCYEGVRVLGWEGVDRIDSSIHHSPLINKMQHNWCSAASQFSLFTTGIFPNQAQTTSPMVCWWRRYTRPGDSYNHRPSDSQSCMPPYRDFHSLVVVLCGWLWVEE